MDYTIRDKVTADFGDGYAVTAEISNTEQAFRWRLVDSDGLATEWTGHYSGLLTLEGRLGSVVYATQYWAGYLPTDKPFRIVEGAQ